MFFSVEKFHKRALELESRRYVGLQSVAPLTAMEANDHPDTPYHSLPSKVEGKPFSIHDNFVGQDAYMWLEKTVRVPDAKEGFEVTGLFDFALSGTRGTYGPESGFESWLFVDGHPYQALDVNHQDVNLEPVAGKTVRLTMLLWTGRKRGGPNQQLVYHFGQADLGYLHKATDELYFYTLNIAKTLELLPEDSCDRYGLISAMDEALALINWDEDKFYSTVGGALACLTERLSAARKPAPMTVHYVGHTHIDVAWLWRLKHTREKAMRSFTTVLRLMEEFDDYYFLQTQPQLYQYIKNDCPELYERISKKIAEGKWEADGGMWLEADCNISSGEALVRQMVYGTNFLKEEFGVDCKYLWLPDVFGYSWALPQILRQCNIKTFMTTKISWNQFNSIPNDLFQWRGLDGSEILTYFINCPDERRPINTRFSTYNGKINPTTALGGWQRFRNKDISNDILIAFGFGDGGGGPTREMLKTARVLDKLPGMPNVKTGRADEFFELIHRDAEQAGENLPVWDGELYLEYHRGTYTTQAYNKKMNRLMEFKAATAEWLSVLALLSGGKYDSEAIHEAWTTILRNQFHDIIPGSSIREVYQDSKLEYEEADKTLSEVEAGALDTLVSAAPDCYTIYNFGSFPRTDRVFLPRQEESGFADREGRPLKAQKVAGGYLVQLEIPAMSMCTIHTAQPVPQAPSPLFHVNLGARVLETPFYDIAWNEQGQLCRLFDKENNRCVLKGCGNVLELFEDRPMKYDAWDIDIFYTQKRETAVLSKPVEVVENGSLRAVLRFTFAYNQSQIVQDMTVYADCRRIDFVTRVDWHEDHRLLKAAFEVDVRAAHAAYDIQFGHVERAIHANTSWDWAKFEVVAHKWADLSESNYGVSLLNDCKYGHSIKNNVMKISLLKSSKDPDPQADMGTHNFTYSLLPHRGGFNEGQTIEESFQLNLPLGLAEGTVPDSRPVFQVEGGNIVVDAVKKAEKSGQIVLRIHECRGGTGPVVITAGFEAKSVTECNLLEQPTAAAIPGGRVSLTVKPFEIKTFLFEV